jgi:hypothetical protein
MGKYPYPILTNKKEDLRAARTSKVLFLQLSASEISQGTSMLHPWCYSRGVWIPAQISAVANRYPPADVDV